MTTTTTTTSSAKTSASTSHLPIVGPSQVLTPTGAFIMGFSPMPIVQQTTAAGVTDTGLGLASGLTLPTVTPQLTSGTMSAMSIDSSGLAVNGSLLTPFLTMPPPPGSTPLMTSSPLLSFPLVTAASSSAGGGLFSSSSFSPPPFVTGAATVGGRTKTDATTTAAAKTDVAMVASCSLAGTSAAATGLGSVLGVDSSTSYGGYTQQPTAAGFGLDASAQAYAYYYDAYGNAYPNPYYQPLPDTSTMQMPMSQVSSQPQYYFDPTYGYIPVTSSLFQSAQTEYNTAAATQSHSGALAAATSTLLPMAAATTTSGSIRTSAVLPLSTTISASATSVSSSSASSTLTSASGASESHYPSFEISPSLRAAFKKKEQMRKTATEVALAIDTIEEGDDGEEQDDFLSSPSSSVPVSATATATAEAQSSQSPLRLVVDVMDDSKVMDADDEYSSSPRGGDEAKFHPKTPRLPLPSAPPRPIEVKRQRRSEVRTSMSDASVGGGGNRVFEDSCSSYSKVYMESLLPQPPVAPMIKSPPSDLRSLFLIRGTYSAPMISAADDGSEFWSDFDWDLAEFSDEDEIIKGVIGDSLKGGSSSSALRRKGSRTKILVTADSFSHSETESPGSSSRSEPTQRMRSILKRKVFGFGLQRQRSHSSVCSLGSVGEKDRRFAEIWGMKRRHLDAIEARMRKRRDQRKFSLSAASSGQCERLQAAEKRRKEKSLELSRAFFERFRKHRMRWEKHDLKSKETCDMLALTRERKLQRIEKQLKRDRQRTHQRALKQEQKLEAMQQKLSEEMEKKKAKKLRKELKAEKIKSKQRKSKVAYYEMKMRQLEEMRARETEMSVLKEMRLVHRLKHAERVRLQQLQQKKAAASKALSCRPVLVNEASGASVRVPMVVAMATAKRKLPSRKSTPMSSPLLQSSVGPIIGEMSLPRIVAISRRPRSVSTSKLNLSMSAPSTGKRKSPTRRIVSSKDKTELSSGHKKRRKKKKQATDGRKAPRKKKKKASVSVVRERKKKRKTTRPSASVPSASSSNIPKMYSMERTAVRRSVDTAFSSPVSVASALSIDLLSTLPIAEEKSADLKKGQLFHFKWQTVDALPTDGSCAVVDLSLCVAESKSDKVKRSLQRLYKECSIGSFLKRGRVRRLSVKQMNALAREVSTLCCKYAMPANCCLLMEACICRVLLHYGSGLTALSLSQLQQSLRNVCGDSGHASILARSSALPYLIAWFEDALRSCLRSLESLSELAVYGDTEHTESFQVTDRTTVMNLAISLCRVLMQVSKPSFPPSLRRAIVLHLTGSKERIQVFELISNCLSVSMSSSMSALKLSYGIFGAAVDFINHFMRCVAISNTDDDEVVGRVKKALIVDCNLCSVLSLISNLVIGSSVTQSPMSVPNTSPKMGALQTTSSLPPSAAASSGRILPPGIGHLVDSPSSHVFGTPPLKAVHGILLTKVTGSLKDLGMLKVLTRAFDALNKMAAIDMTAVQFVVADYGFEFYHVLNTLLPFVTGQFYMSEMEMQESEEKSEVQKFSALNQHTSDLSVSMLAFIGYVTLCNEKTQDIFRWNAHKLSLANRLMQLPFFFFSADEGCLRLMPALIGVCYGNPQMAAEMNKHMSLLFVTVFLQRSKEIVQNSTASIVDHSTEAKSLWAVDTSVRLFWHIIKNVPLEDLKRFFEKCGPH